MYLKLMILPIYVGNASHFNQAAQLNVNDNQSVAWHFFVGSYVFFSAFRYFQISKSVKTHLAYLSWSFCFFESDLHAVQCGAGAAHTAGPEAALLRQGPVAQGQQLTAQLQVLPAQPGLKATLGVLSEQLAASADVLCSELWERRRAVSIIPGQGKKSDKAHNNSQKILT